MNRFRLFVGCCLMGTLGLPACVVDGGGLEGADTGSESTSDSDESDGGTEEADSGTDSQGSTDSDGGTDTDGTDEGTDTDGTDEGTDTEGGTDTGGDRSCEPIFFDDFEYTIDAVEDLQDHGWNWAKAINLTGSHRGTITSDAGRLRFDLDGEGGQTDVYTELVDILPNVTFEFDLYVDEDAGGIGHRFKFLYPSVNGSYPQPVETLRWLLLLSPNHISPELFLGDGSELYIELQAHNYAQATDPQIAPENQWKLGQNLSLTPVTLGEWHHVVVHIDTSGPGGVYEAWLDGEKVSEWIDGVTPDFSFALPPEARTPHAALRVITTVDDDMTIMFDDFAMCG